MCPSNTRMEMYAGRIACCSLVSHVECALRRSRHIKFRKKNGTDRQMDGRRPDFYITLTARSGQPNNVCRFQFEEQILSVR